MMKPAVSLSLTILAALLFSVLLRSLPEVGASVLERQILAELGSWRTPSLDVFFSIFTWLGSFYMLGPLVALTTAALLIQRSKWQGFYLAAVFYGSSLTTVVLKHLLGRDRPDFGTSPVVMLPGDPSFPSGHSTHALAFGLAVAIVIWGRGTRMRWLAVLLLLIGCVIAFSRLYLQVHWPGDIAAGGLVALFWSSVSAIFAGRYFNLGKGAPHEENVS